MSLAEKKLALEVAEALSKRSDPTRVASLSRFFKANKGDYGEGDKFLGANNPTVRDIAKHYISLEKSKIRDGVKAGARITIGVVRHLIESPYNEQRFLALLFLNHCYKTSATDDDRKVVYATYMDLAHANRINNWNLVDLSAPDVVGQYFLHVAKSAAQRKPLLAMLGQSNSLWIRRIGVVSMLTFVRNKELALPIRVCQAVLCDTHDLMHKACGWVLREIGKKDKAVLCQFLEEHAATMPRTALRYAVERLGVEERQKYMDARKKRERE